MVRITGIGSAVEVLAKKGLAVKRKVIDTVELCTFIPTSFTSRLSHTMYIISKNRNNLNNKQRVSSIT